MSKDYYKTLGIDRNASQEEIKKAFRKKAHEFHPDKKGGDEAKFKEINEAYQILGNEQKKKQYDQFGEAAFSGQGFGGTGMNWEDFARAAQGGFSGNGTGFNINIDDLGDIFGGLGDIFGFNSAHGHNNIRRGDDIKISLSIDFKESVFGVEKQVSLYKINKCGKCHGNGAEPGTPIETCKICKGSGYVISLQRTILGNFQTRSTCSNCQGQGKVATKKCSACSGSGLEKTTSDINVKIPAGISDGQTIRLNGQGNASTSGVNGDLYIIIKVKSDSHFTRKGDDILSVTEVSFAQAALGDKIPVLTIDGSITLKIPAGTQSGTVFKLRGKGSYSIHGRGRGDHLVEVIVKTPQRLSRQQKKLFEELKNI